MNGGAKCGQSHRGETEWLQGGGGAAICASLARSGAVAQMGERCNRTAEVRGSIPLSSTSMATFDEQMKLIAGPVAALVSSYDVSFICKCFDRNEETSEPIWVDCDGGMKRIAASSVDKVTAEGDYMRVHSNGHGWMVHATMRSIVERLPSREFVKVHRSTLVRCNFIDRLVLEDGRWVAWLEDGSRENVARSQVKETFRIIRSNPAIPTVDSSKGESIHLD